MARLSPHTLALLFIIRKTGSRDNRTFGNTCRIVVGASQQFAAKLTCLHFNNLARAEGLCAIFFSSHQLKRGKKNADSSWSVSTAWDLFAWHVFTRDITHATQVKAKVSCRLPRKDVSGARSSQVWGHLTRWLVPTYLHLRFLPVTGVESSPAYYPKSRSRPRFVSGASIYGNH